jgi:hypothetical protein
MKAHTPGGKDARKLYRKVLKLANIMVLYTSALELYIINKQLEDNKLALEKTQASLSRMSILTNDLTKYKLMESKDQTIYIMATYSQAIQGVYKIGKTKGVKKQRESSLNTSHPVSDEMVTLHEIKCNDSNQLETRIHNVLKHIRHDNKREYFQGPYNILVDICDKIASRYDDDIDSINIIIYDLIESSKLGTVDYVSGLDMTKLGRHPNGDRLTDILTITLSTETEEKSQRIDIRDMTEEQKKVVYKDIISKYIQKNENCDKYDFDTYKDYKLSVTNSAENISEPAKVVWTDIAPIVKDKLIIHGKFKSTQMYGVFKQLIAGAVGISFKKFIKS